MQRTIEVLADKAALVERGLAVVVEKIEQAIAQRGRCTLVLAGGSTPKPLYEALAQQDLPWGKLFIFWGDERYVPMDHPDSNAGMAKAAWLDRVPIPPEQIFPMLTNVADPAIAAQQYEATLTQCFATSEGAWPRFDVILLGIGDDAHTASLFPGTAALTVSDRQVTVGDKAGQPRITLTAPLINQARAVVFLVAGANKQTALAHIFADQDDNQRYPARLIHPDDGELWWLLDQEAGSGMAASTLSDN
ncbi:MAG: 6-phosphogluconolactonase [Cyanobacteria bacterium J06642_9]